MNESSQPDPGFERLVEVARAAAAHPADPTTDHLGRARLVERVLRNQRRPLTHWVASFPRAAWLAVAACILVGFAWGLAARPIGFVVRGMPASGSYVRAGDDRAVDVDFSDGTRIQLDAGARMRVDERRMRGARVLLERGRVVARVVHRTGADWCFVAGPFEVQVKGTRFSLDWDPNAEQLDLKLEEGLVEVVGPLGPRQVSLRAGQQLVVNLRSRSLTLLESNSASPEPSASPAASAAFASAPASAAQSPSSADVEEPNAAIAGANGAALPAASPAPVAWSKLLAKGQFATIVRLAESPERSNCAESCGATDLRVLAEAARYVGRNDLAEATLLALRRRFPEHTESARAAFLLGRLYEARTDNTRAEQWYRTHLRESPTSAFAADALAALMRMVRHDRSAKAAEPLAQEYLRRYPAGVHAAAARQILSEQ